MISLWKRHDAKKLTWFWNVTPFCRGRNSQVHQNNSRWRCEIRRDYVTVFIENNDEIVYLTVKTNRWF